MGGKGFNVVELSVTIVVVLFVAIIVRRCMYKGVRIPESLFRLSFFSILFCPPNTIYFTTVFDHAINTRPLCNTDSEIKCAYFGG